MNRMFLLQKSISTYFLEIDKNQKVITTKSCIEAMLFFNKNDAKKFKNTLKNVYDIKFKIIEI